ncbi:hypothetical protein C8R47DRAFT_1084136 [Mycena vitilis]|nr:hypothetical protein C8R47DRAFT_1084136 [Mycena vitilis]
MPSSSSSQTTKSSQRPPRKFTIRRRRTIIACSSCRRRKIRCITTEQPPTNPCAYCTRKRLTCEYVAADGPFGRSRKGSPDLSVADRPESRTDSSPSPSPPLWTPPVTPANFSPQPARTGSSLLHPDPEAVDQSRCQFSPSAFCSTQPALPPAPSFPWPHPEVSTQQTASLHHGYSCPTPDFGPNPNRRHSSSGLGSNAYDLQAAHAYQYLCSRASSLHTTYPCSPDPPGFFVDYSQIPGLADIRYEWPPIFSSPHG